LQAQLFSEHKLGSLSDGFLGLAIGALVALMMAIGLFATANTAMRDILMQSYPVSDIVTIVAVDDASLERYGRWSDWPRTLHARLIERLKDAEARVIVLDYLLAEQTPEDEQLSRAMQQAGIVIQPVLGQGDALLDTPGVVRYKGRLLPQPGLLASSATIGHANVLHDADGIVRRMPTMIQINGENHLNLALAALKIYLGGKQAAQTPTNLVPATNVLDFAGRQVPVGNFGEMLINFSRPPARPGETTFNRVSLQAVLDGTAPVDLLKNKIVLVGVVATAESDRYLTPVSSGRPMYGVEILANVIEMIWSGRFLNRPSVGLQVVVLLVLGAITGLFGSRPWIGILLAGAIAGTYFLFASWVFDTSGLQFDLFYPFLCVALTSVGVMAYRYSREIRQRRAVLEAIEFRVSPETAINTVQAVHRGKISLERQIKEITALVIELRGFSEYAELYEPEKVGAALDDFHKSFNETVFDHGGTLIDGKDNSLQAIFNVPLPQADHAQRAALCAIKIKKRLEQYHLTLPDDHPHRCVKMSFGIYTGRAMVGYSQIGRRNEFSALGEPLQIAQQLANIAEPAQILTGGPAYEAIQDQILAEPFGPVMINKNAASITAYNVIDAGA
jgi:adenylate cyclase